MIVRRCAGGVVFYANKVLLLKNDRDEWTLPKGKIHDGELAQDSAIHRVKEETGITVKDIKYLGSDFVKGKELLMLTYLAYYESGEIEKSTEVEGAAWYNIEDALCELNEDSIGKRVVKKVLKEIGYEGTNAFRCEGNNCNV